MIAIQKNAQPYVPSVFLCLDSKLWADAGIHIWRLSAIYISFSHAAFLLFASLILRKSNFLFLSYV